MKIGIDLRALLSPYRTGVGEYAAELASALVRVSNDHSYVFFINSAADYVLPETKDWTQKNVSIVRTACPNKLLNASIAAFRTPKIDKIISKRVGALDIFFSPNFNFTSVSNNTKFFLTVHDLSFEFFPDCFSPKQRMWHKAVRAREQCVRADGVFVLSENTKRDIIDYYGIDSNKVNVIFPGISSSFKIAKPEESKNIKIKYNLPEKYILSVGAIEPRKNIDGLICAFQHWKIMQPASAKDFFLIIAGPRGYKADKLMDFAKGDDSIRFLGYVSGDDRPGIYANASLFVLPSFYEGFGFPVLEAMASGAPVVASNRSSLPEVGGDAVYFVNPYNINDIADGIHTMVSDESLRAKYIEMGLARARSFNWDDTARAFLSFLD